MSRMILIFPNLTVSRIHLSGQCLNATTEWNLLWVWLFQPWSQLFHSDRLCVQNQARFLNNLQEIYTSVNSSAYKLQNYTKNAFFMSHWGENEQRFSYQAPTITDLLLFYFLFPGEMYWPPPPVTGPQWEGWRHPSILVFRLPERFEEEAGAQGIPIPATWKPCHSLFTALPRLCETRPFFSKSKEYMILSLIFLYLSEPVTENRAKGRLPAVGLECWPVCKCLLIIFSCSVLFFLYCMYIYGQLVWVCLVTV